jgi:hypothetical protein
MSTRNLTERDWNEIFNALETKAASVERGAYDFFPGEAASRKSKTLAWAKHLRRIMEKISDR